MNGIIDTYEESANNRENARFVKIRIETATDKYVYGLLIFPDIFKWTDKMGEIPYGINTSDLLWTATESTPCVDNYNTYSTDQFAAMENAGCVFLPAAGYRSAKSWQGNKVGHYWSSDPVLGNANNSFQMIFNGNGTDNSFVLVRGIARKDGRSVRLVHD